MPPVETITVVVDESPVVMTPDVMTISGKLLAEIEKVVAMTHEANKIKHKAKTEKEEKKTLELIILEALMLKFLEFPSGVTKADILITAQTTELISTLNKFRAYLRKNNKYTLKKRKLKKEYVYVLDPIR